MRYFESRLFIFFETDEDMTHVAVIEPSKERDNSFRKISALEQEIKYLRLQEFLSYSPGAPLS